MIELNVIYTDHPGSPQLMLENDIGKVWLSKSYNGNIANIAMNAYSAIKIQENDSIFIIEPICVSQQNYNINFLKKFRFIFTWATKIFQNTNIENKVIYTNLPSYKGNPQINTTNWLSWHERSDEIVFIANNKSSHHPSQLYSLRIKLADWLYTNSRFKVSWYGNMPVQKPYYKGKAPNKFDILRKVKFHVCMENAYDPIYSYNYLSEKMPDAWFAGTVPIYLGCSNLNELGINNECYIDLLPFRTNFNQLESKLKSFTTKDYKNMTQQYSKLSNNMYALTSYENVFNIMLKSYGHNNNI